MLRSGTFLDCNTYILLKAAQKKVKAEALMKEKC